MSPPLLIIVPTRGRPENAVALWESWQAASTGAADLLFAVDEDDPELDHYIDVTGRMPGVFTLTGPRLRMVGTLNATATTYAPWYRYLGFMGDDHRVRTTGWDARFMECLSGGTGIVYGNDLLQGPEMPTAVAMTSDIVTTLGYMAPPSMVHLCIDLVWKLWGERLDRLTYLDDVVIEHMHPANRKAPMDAGYEDANNPERMAADSAAFYAYRDGGGLDADIKKLRTLL